MLALWANRAAFYPLKYPAGQWAVREELGVEDVFLDAPGARLHAWWKPAPGPAAAVLFLHGNAGNVTHRGPHIEAIAGAGAAVLAPDYRGYGKSTGWPSERGLYQDALAGYEFLLARGYPAGRIILHGESLGTAVAVELAAARPCAGLILEAGFPSARAVAQEVLPGIGPLLVWGFDSRARIGRVGVPLLVIHGERDEVIPLRLGRALFEAAPGRKHFWAIPHAHHNDLLSFAGPAYTGRLRSFIMDACNAADSSPRPR